MKKRNILVVLASFSMAAAGLIAIFPKGNMAKTEATSVTYSTNFAHVWEQMGGEEEQYNVNPSVSDNFYSGNTSIQNYTYSIVKGGHSTKIRNYNKTGSTFYAVLGAANSGDNPNPSYLVTNTTYDGFKILSFSVQVRTDYGSKPVMIPSTTFSATEIETLTWNNGVANYAFDTPVDNIMIANMDTSVVCNMLNLTITLVKGNVLTFDSQGGSSVDAQYLVSGEHPVEPNPAPTRPNEGANQYVLDSWWTTPDGDNTGTKIVFETYTISGDTTIYAHWRVDTLSKVTISFESNGGSDVNDLEVDYGTVATKPTDPSRSASNPNKYYFNFSGWYIDAELTAAFNWDDPVYQDYTLYAKWSFQLRNNAPSDREHYTFKTNISTWKADYNPTEDSTYYYNSDVTLNTANTFATTKTPLNVRFVGHGSYGFFIRKNNPGIRYCDIYVTPVDPSKIIVYFKLTVTQWGSHNDPMSLYKNDVNEAVDTDTTPLGDESTHYLEKSFSSSERVSSVKLSMPSTILILQDMFVKVAEDPYYTAANTYAEGFNDANVCGSTDESGLDTKAWEDQKDAYDALDPEVQSYLATCTITEGEIGEMLERYDTVIAKHGESYDFMGRVAAGTISAMEHPNGITALNDNSLSVAIICIAFTLTFVSVAVIYYRKHRREE